MNVLIVEDDAIAAEMLRNALLEFGYDVTMASNGCEALGFIQSGKFRLIISDWEMPEMSGVEMCRRVREQFTSAYIYIILLTSRSGTQNIVEGLTAGADEFLTKPFHPRELYARLRVAERLLSVESREVTIFSLAKLAESRDSETGKHLERIREYCRVLAESLSRKEQFAEEMAGDYVELIYQTSPLHDIGKVAIPDRILLKPGSLTADEFNVMKRHAELGAETLEAALNAHPEAKYLQMARDIALTHHEKFDGTGYPVGLRGKEIPLCGRIVAVADVYDALTTKRVYKPAFDHEDARSIIIKDSGKHFDPDVVLAFVEQEPRILDVKQQYQDTELAIDADTYAIVSQI